ncbi:MAG: type 1 glutamine amidotransferase [Pseudonocardiaceae bacterium]|nr:type 1 glutamine amidotransferase [Pseudonocardiaceae bacterium]
MPWRSNSWPAATGSLAGVAVRLLVLQPSEIDPPERLGEWLAEAGAELDVRRPAVDGVPDTLDGFDGVVCLGGEMGAHDLAEHPWLADVRRLLAEAVSRRVPLLAICLGAQLLAVATGGHARRSPQGPEAGPRLVARRDASGHDPLFGELPLTPDVIQFHHDEIHRLASGTLLLASSPRHENQAFRVGPCAYGLQFHIETSPDVVLQWARGDPEAAATMPPGSLQRERLDEVHADVDEAWRPVAGRFVALCGSPTPSLAELAAGDRPVLPLLGH